MEQQEQNLRAEHQALQAKLQAPDIYSSKEYPALAKRASKLEEVIDLFNQKKAALKDQRQAEELKHSEDPTMQDLAMHELAELRDKLAIINTQLEEALLPKDPNDERNAVVEIRAAAGGDEAALFAGDLFRMYSRWCEKHGFKTELISESPAEGGGFKEIIFMVHGDNTYGQLKFEAGVHRVQRIPTTESQGRIHTSTATVAVLPEAEETDIEIKPEDIRIDIFRSSGPGGQSVNTTDSAVRITHLPTGMVVSQQDEKSQIKNKAKAMSVLRSRLLQAKIEEEQKEQTDARLKLIGSGDRSEKIRTYNFPQDRITDHRINYSRSNLPGALNGDIDDLIEKLQAAELELLKGGK